jgi:hypothetical protein
MKNIQSISTDDVDPKNEKDKRCSPGNKFEFSSCIKLELLIEMAKSYNKEFENNKIDLGGQIGNNISILNPGKFKKYLLKEFGERLKQKCSTQKCWSEQNFIKHMNKKYKEELEKYTWRPSGPDTGTEWLNTQHITDVLEQYEKKFDDFKFLGAMPRDFQDHSIFEQTEEFYEDLIKNGKTKLGIVYNTHKVGQPGEHWNSLFADLAKGEIYFFDSYGTSPNSDTRKHMRLLTKISQKNCDNIIKISRNHTNLIKKELSCKLPKKNHNKIRHQYKGSECGVYSMYFIYRMLEGDDFDKICESKVSDDEINKFRKLFFRDD